MSRFALTLAVALVLSSTTGIHAFHHFGCGACGHRIGCCGLGLFGFGGCGLSGCGFGGCGYAHSGCGFGECGLSYGGCGQGCGTAISYGSAPVYGGYVSMQPGPAFWTARSLNNMQSKSSKIGANGPALNPRARTIVVDLRSFDLDAPSIQMSGAATKVRSGLVVQDESVK
jgi:hypothetical protein